MFEIGPISQDFERLFDRVAILERAAMALKETRDADYSHLIRRINRLENKLATISNSDQILTQIGSIGDKLDKLDEVDKRLSQVDSIQEDLKNLSEKVENLEGSSNDDMDVSSTLNEVQGLIVSAQRDIDSFNRTLTQSQRRTKSDFEEIDMKIENIASRVEMLGSPSDTTSLQSLENKITTLKARLDAIVVAPQDQEINTRVTMLENGIVALATNVSLWRQDLISEDAILSNGIEANEQAIKDLINKQEALMNQITSLETKPTSEESDSSVTMLKDDVKKLETNFSAWQIEFDEEKLKIERNDLDIQKLATNQTLLLNTFEERVSTIKDDLQGQLDEFFILQQNVTTLKEEIQEIKGKLGDIDLESCCSVDEYEVPTLPDYSDDDDQTTGATARADEIKTDVVFCGENPSYQRNRFQPLVFKEVRLQDTKFLDQETGIFRVPANGKYLFTIYLNTRTCGSLSLCGATVVQLWKNEESMREFKIGSASDRRNDLESISGVTFLELIQGDLVSLQLSETIFDGVNNLEFCGVKLN